MATKEARCAETAAPLARFPADIKPTFLGLRHQLGHQLGYIWRGGYIISLWTLWVPRILRVGAPGPPDDDDDEGRQADVRRRG
jgi:hypothetical protein